MEVDEVKKDNLKRTDEMGAYSSVSWCLEDTAIFT